DAIDLLIQEGKSSLTKGAKVVARDTFRKALAGANDRDQVDILAKHLKELGVEVDLAAHFGFIQKWRLLGPFDNHDGVGFQKTFPPEKSVNMSEAVKGREDAPLHWTEHTTSDPYGLVDLNKA